MSTKRYYTAVEVEAMLQKERTSMEHRLVVEAEKIAVKTIVSTAKRNGRIGDKMLINIPPTYVHIPDWQRKCDMVKAKSIGLNYNPCKWDVPKVIYCNGKFECVDGMHRIVGAFLGQDTIIKKNGTGDVVVELLDISESEAIELFLNQSKDRKHMSPADYFNASLRAGKPEYILMRDICTVNGVQIKGYDFVQNPIGTFTSILDGVNMCKTNPETFKRIIAFIAKLQWNDISSDYGAFSAKYIRIFKKLYAYYANDVAAMESIIAKYCSGSAWFIDKAMRTSQEELFDELSSLVSKGISSERVLKLA